MEVFFPWAAGAGRHTEGRSVQAGPGPAARKGPTHIPSHHKSPSLHTSVPLRAPGQVCFWWLLLVQVVHIAIGQKRTFKGQDVYVILR